MLGGCVGLPTSSRYWSEAKGRAVIAAWRRSGARAHRSVATLRRPFVLPLGPRLRACWQYTHPPGTAASLRGVGGVTRCHRSRAARAGAAAYGAVAVLQTSV